MKKALLSFAFIAAGCAALEPDYIELSPQYMEGSHDVGRPISNWTSNGYAVAFTLGWDVGRRETMRTALLNYMQRMERMAETDLATHDGGSETTVVVDAGSDAAQPADETDEPMDPERSLDLAIKGLIGLFAAVLLGILAKYKDRLFNGKAKPSDPMVDRERLSRTQEKDSE